MNTNAHLYGRVKVNVERLLQLPIDSKQVEDIIDHYDDFYASIPVQEEELILVQIASDWNDIFDDELDVYSIIMDLRDGFLVGEAECVETSDLDEMLKAFVEKYGCIMNDLTVIKKGDQVDDYQQFKIIKDVTGAHLQRCQAELTVSYNNWRVA